MQRLGLYAAIAIAGGVLIGLLFFWHPLPEENLIANTQITGSQPEGGDFTLSSYRGPVNLSDFRGKVVILYFGYTWCPDICPTNLSMISSTLAQMDSTERDQIQPLFVSVDPGRDTPQRLKEYVEYFHPSLIGLTGSKSQIDEIVRRYGGAYHIPAKRTDTHYVVDHTADTYIIDKQGKLVRRMAHGSGVEEMLGALRPLLQENLSK